MRLTALAMMWAIATIFNGSAFAQDAQTDPIIEASLDAAPPSKVTVAAEPLDAALAAAADEDRFSGAIVGLVGADGEVWAQGYGIADSSSDAAISLETSRFLVASVTKTLTSISILQLYDRGEIASLDDPANLYLKRVQLPLRSGEDVTIRHLLTHTSGLRTLGFGYIRRHQLDAPVDAAFVKRHTPGLVRTPGEAVVYSNIGMSLLGTLLEDVTGDTLQAYMAREIFAPLDMQSAVLNYEIAPSVEHARAYRVDGETLTEMPFDANTPFLAPAGSAMLSAADLQKYAAFWLDGGRTWSADILSASVFDEMITEQARNHSGANGIGLGVFIADWNGTRMLIHSGAFGGYTAYFAVSEDTGLAGFMAVAGAPAMGRGSPFLAYGEGANALLTALSGKPAITFSPQPIDDAARYAGLYVNDRRFTRGIGKFVGLISPMSVGATPDGFLTIGGAAGLGRVEDGVIAAAGDGISAPSQYGLPDANMPYFKMNADRARRAGFFETPANLISLLGAGALLCLIGSAGIFGPARADGTVQRVAKWAPLIGIVAVGGIFAALQLFYPPGGSIVGDLIAGKTGRAFLINSFSWIILLSAILTIFAMVVARRSGPSQRGWAWRLLGVSAAIGLILLSIFTVSTGLADPRLV